MTMFSRIKLLKVFSREASNQISHANIEGLLLFEDEDLSTSEESDSEKEDHLEVEDVESDIQSDASDREDDQIHTHVLSSTYLPDHEFDGPPLPPPLLPPNPQEESTDLLSQRNIHNRHVWATSKGRTSGKTASIKRRTGKGPTGAVRDVVDPLILFEQFIIDQMLEEIVKWTNAKITVKKQRITSTQGHTNKEEIRALMGILILSVALKDNHLSLDEMFNTEFSGTRYAACMSKERCGFLLRCLRFDNKAYRLQRQKDDPFTPIRNIWEMLVTQCRQNYEPGTNVTIDEQLLAFRGKCKFRMYNPNKTANYGIKLVMMCDSDTHYMINCLPYLGKGMNTGGVLLSEYFVKELTRSIHGTNRNVTMGNRFTSVPLARELLQQPYKLSVLGTLRANREEIPEEIKNCRSRNINSSIFRYDGCLTLLSFKPKRSKMVYLLSSRDEEGTVNTKTQKPHMIEFYNSTKSAVDIFDQMCAIMSCSRRANRWPMCVFYGMLNIACINSYIIYCHNKSAHGESIMRRRDFMKKLHSQMVEPWLKTRLHMRTMPKHVKEKIGNVLAVKNKESQGEGQSTSFTLHDPLSEASAIRKRKLCGFCSYKKRRMTKSICSKCNTAICGEHKVDFCQNCAMKV